MKIILALLFWSCVFSVAAYGQDPAIGSPLPADVTNQTPDSLAQASTAAAPGDSVKPDLSALLRFQQALANHPQYLFFRPAVRVTMEPLQRSDTDSLFYALLGLVFFYALVHSIFYKYVNSLAALFFRVSMRQQQLREQVAQAQLPGLLLNLLFVISGGLFAAFLARHYQWLPDRVSLTEVWAYGSGLLFLLYTGKFLLLKMTGWIFKVSQATDTYISIVFMVNKIMGIALLPVLWFLAFPHPAIYQIVITLSVILVAGLFVYRFFISYRPVRNEIKVSPFHFFIYLCAFEIAPLILIYKVLIKVVASHF